MAIRLPDETREHLVASIRRFFEEDLDAEIGDLKARLVLDFVLAEVAPSIYNRAIGDAQAYVAERLEDLGAVCHEPEPRDGTAS